MEAIAAHEHDLLPYATGVTSPVGVADVAYVGGNTPVRAFGDSLELLARSRTMTERCSTC